MKFRDSVIISIIVLNFSWFGWRMYAADHVPMTPVTTVSTTELIGKTTNLLGNSNAKYVVVEFGDYQCPPCAQMYTQIEEFTKLNPGKIRFQFRHYPLPSHDLAFPAALIAEKARKSGNFEAIHKALYSLKANLDEETLRAIAGRYNISYTSASDLKGSDKEYKALIVNDKIVANKVPIKGTPSLFLCSPDQKVYQVYNLSQVKDLIGSQRPHR